MKIDFIRAFFSLIIAQRPKGGIERAPVNFP